MPPSAPTSPQWMERVSAPRRHPLAPAVLLAAVATTAPAAAQYSETYVKRPQTVSDGMFQFRGDVFFNLSDRSVSRPLILAPSLEYGVSDRFQLALRHENSFCFNGCDFYRGVGFEAKYVFARGSGFSFSIFGGPYIDAFEPFLLQLRTGLGFWAGVSDTFALNGNLYFGWGLTYRDRYRYRYFGGYGSYGAGNVDVFALNLQPSVNFSPRFAGFIDTGFYSTLGTFENDWAIPFGLGIIYTHKRNLDLGLDFKFPRFVAAPNTGSLAYRQLDLLMRYRF
jgi:hypothetical protein